MNLAAALMVGQIMEAVKDSISIQKNLFAELPDPTYSSKNTMFGQIGLEALWTERFSGSIMSSQYFLL